MTPEERKAYMRAWHQANKEEQKAYIKVYSEAHKDEKKAYDAIYCETNKEDKKLYRQTPNAKKLNTIRKWKQSGLIHEDYNQLYELYINTTKCDVCKVDFKDSSDRCMDHDHETNLFRQFLCQSCNRNDAWKKLVPSTPSQHGWMHSSVN